MEQFIIIETLRQLHAEGQTLSSGAAYYNKSKTSGEEMSMRNKET